MPWLQYEAPDEFNRIVGSFARTGRIWGLATMIGTAFSEAELGFNNHWYPAMRSADLGEGDLKALIVLGEDLAFKRIEGRV